MPNPIVQIRGLSKAYRRDSMQIPVLRDITLEVPEGEFLGLMGPSGSGKTTLLNLIAGIDRPDAGSVLVAGTDVTTLSESQLARWRATHIGFVFQFYNLIPVLTAFENVELPLLLTSLSKRERKQHVETALALVDLADRVHHYPRQLSGGQEQRQLDVLECREHGEQVVELEHEPDVRGPPASRLRFAQFGDVGPGDRHRPGVGTIDAGDQVQ